MPRTSETTTSKWLEIAIDHHQKERFRDAERLYRRLLRRDANNPDALHFLGVLKHQGGASAEAIELIRRAVDVRPDYADAHNNLGRILAESGDVENAIQCCEEAIRLRKDFADAYFNLGVCLRKEERPDDAITALQRADALNPDSARTCLQLGRACNEADRSEDACRYYTKAIAADPNQTKSYESLGVQLYALGRLDEAADVYRKWMEVDPSNPRASHMYSSCSGEEPPSRASNEYIVSVFDQFADSFDAKLAKLAYRAPALVCEALSGATGSATGFDILDAGCGTGLCGPLLRPLAASLDGVDLSPSMIGKAKLLDTYDALVVDELVALMHERISAYDIVVSADTLVYFGDLSPPFLAIEGTLRSCGWLVFTVELSDTDDSDYVLNPHGRYSHSEAYVRHELERSGFEVKSVEAANLRIENKKPVRGMVVLAKRIR